MNPNESDRRSQGREIARLASGTFAGTLIGAALMFVNEILVARLLGVETYGLYALGLMAARVGEILCMLGLRVSVLHFLPIYLKEAKRTLVAGIIRAGTMLPALAAAAYVAAIWFSSQFIDDAVFKGVGGAPFMSMLVLAVPAMCLSEIFGNITRAYGFARYHVITRSIVPPVVYFALISTIMALGLDKFSVTLAFVASHGAGLVVGAICVWIVSQPGLRHVRPSPAYRRLYAYAFPIFINSLLYVGMAWTGLWFVGMYGSAAEIGMYRAAMQITIVFEMIALAFNAATSHIFPVAIIERDHERLQRTYGHIVRLVSTIALPALIVTMSASSDILGLLGDEFRAGWIALTMLAIAQTVQCCSSCAGFVLVIGRFQTVETFNVLLAVTCNVILCWLLVPAYGIHGAAGAAVGSFSLFAVLRVRSASRVLGLVTLLPALVRTWGISAIGALASLGLVVLLPFDTMGGLTALAAKCFVSASIMAVLLWNWALDADERGAVRLFVSSRFGRHGRAT